MSDDSAVAFVDVGQFPGIDEYFRLVPFVFLAPLRPRLRIKKVVPLEAMTLTSLVDAMSMELTPGQSAVIYSHGSADALRIGRTNSLGKDYVTASDFNYLANYVAGIKNKTIRNLNPSHSGFHIDGSVGAALIDNLISIQKLQIDHLCVLACNTGNGDQLLYGMKRAFGARSISGPKFQCAFGQIQFGLFNNQEEFGGMLAKIKHGIGGWHTYGTTPGRRLVFHRVVNPKSSFTFTRNDSWAESAFAVADFQRDICGHHVPGGYVQERPLFYLHGLETKVKMVLPGEADYQRHFSLL